MFVSRSKITNMLEGRYFALAVICSLALCIKVAAEVPLDMAPDAVDDMYNKCEKDALNKFVFSDLLKEELNNSEAFQKAWHDSQTSGCTKVIPGGVKEHTTALQTVTSAENFRTTLNNAVYTYGTNTSTYEDNFYFKSLHFLLMDSIRLLYPPDTCKTVYAFSDPKFSAQKGSSVRFGRFYMAYSSLDVLKETDIDDEDIILGITTCFFAELGDNICHDDDPVTLLSPTEEFTVEDVKTVVENIDVSYHMIILKHSKLESMHNCYMFSRSSDDAPSHWLVLALLTSSFFIIR